MISRRLTGLVFGAVARAPVSLALLLLLLLPVPGGAQQDVEPGALRVGQRVEVEYTPNSGRWLAASVVEVVNDGYSYKVNIAPGQGAAESQTNVHFRRVRAATAATPATPATPAARPAARAAGGKYACTESRYNPATSSYEYDAKGSFVLSAGGRYQYLGFQRPSEGSYLVDAAGKLAFTGGHLGGGVATPIEGRPGRYYLTAPRIGSRWTCGATGAS